MDIANLTYAKIFNIKINDLPDKIIKLSNKKVKWNATKDTKVGNLTVFDP